MTTTTERIPLTERQREVAIWIAKHLAEKGYPPTIREGQLAFSFDSPNGFVCHLRALARKGWVIWNPRHARTIRVVEGCDLGL